MSASSQYYSVTARVGVPHRHEVAVTVPLVGPAGATGPAGAAGASAWNDITGKPSTFAPSAHASTHHTGGSDPLTPASIGAAKDVTEIEVPNSGTSTTTLTTAQLPARVILFIDAATAPPATINLPTPDARQSGLVASIKVQVEGGTADTALITVVHNAANLLSAYSLAEDEGSIDFRWDGYRWVYDANWLLRSSTGRVLELPTTSGTLALTENADSTFRIVGSADGTKKVAFEVDGLTTATTRTLTVPDASGTIARTQDFASPPSIGSTTANSGSFTTLSANNGTLTASAPVLDLAQTWNNAAVAFTGLRFDVTNTNSSTSSRLVHLTVGGTNNAVGIYRDAAGFSASPRFEIGSAGVTWNIRTRTSAGVGCNFDGAVGVGGSLQFGVGATTGAGDVFVVREAADTLALQRTTNPQTFRLYGQITGSDVSATGNYERGYMRWSAAGGVFQIGTEKGSGGGLARALEFQTDGVTRLTIYTDGSSTFAGNMTANNVIGQAGAVFLWSTRTRMYSDADGRLRISNNTQTDFDRLQFGGTTNLFPALKRSSTTLQVRLANDSDFAPLECAGLTLNGNLTASTRNIVTDTTTGTKIGTATTQKIGFFNATPVVQQAAIADATDAATTQARLNDLLAAMRTFGLIAT